jgi:peptidoglycan-associated lipoprotein
MKLNGYLRAVVIAGCVCGLLVGTGCRRRQAQSKLTPEDIGTGGVEMGARPEGEGIRVDVKFTNVQFGYDSFQITDSEVSKIKEVGDYLRANPGTRLVNEGHCDERGTAEYNMSLGENRAQAVRAYLIGLGTDSMRIQTKSFGKERPLDPEHNESAWAKNRRVEFVIYKK